MVNNVHPNQALQNMASDLGLHWLKGVSVYIHVFRVYTVKCQGPVVQSIIRLTSSLVVKC